MFMLRVMAAGALVVWSALAAGVVAGDAKRGEQLFTSEQCVQCHSLKGKGGTLAPDLARRVDRDYTPSVMASLMWNHAPAMWAAMEKQGVKRSSMTPEKAADLFAYFVSARYFEKPGDAARGKLAFGTHKCAGCHGITTSPVGEAPPIAKWESLADPVILAQQMWNHGPKMRAEFAKRKLAWGKITGQELTDMLVYLRNLPETRDLPRTFSFQPSEAGEKLFASKGCVECHTGKRALEVLLKNQTLTEIAVDMWNHQPSMKNPPPTFEKDEMSQIISYIWAKQYFRGNGNATRGKNVFAAKSCASCHEAGAAPKLAKGSDAHSDITMVAALWDHGPTMLASMKAKNLAWPRFTPQEMADVIAYLNSL
ncbi:MAG: c-type cytochrome [Candidatus Solibacter sp.]